MYSVLCLNSCLLFGQVKIKEEEGEEEDREREGGKEKRIGTDTTTKEDD